MRLPDWVRRGELILRRLFDCDGVLWNGDQLYDNVREALGVLRERGLRIAFVTNNATSSRRGYVEKFHRLGIDWVDKEQVFTSGSASASWIKRHSLRLLPPKSRRIYVIGQAGLYVRFSSS